MTRPNGAGDPHTTSHILDLSLTNNVLDITNTKVIPGLSDHDVDITNFSTDYFSTDPHSRPFTSSWDNLKLTILTSMNKHIPQKTPSSRHTLPWFSRELRRQHRKKQRLYRRAQTYNTPENWTAFKTHQKTFSKNIKKAEHEHISTYLANNVRNNPKHFFKFFKSRRQDTTAITALKDYNNTLVTDPELKSQLLNTHFQSVFTHEDDNTPNIPDRPYPPIPPLDITTNGILKLMTTLDTNKATGPDQIPALFLKSYSQHGFRPRRLCETQLITTHHDIVRQLDRRDTKQVDAILLDFAKAFDKVPHKRLTLKLRHYRITGPILHWITAFLTLLLRPIKTEDDCRLLQQDIDAFEQWERLWQMSFRPDKCKVIHFTRSHTYPPHLHLTQPSLNIYSNKYLGIHLSNNFTFNTHTDFINKANRTLGFLRRNLHNCTPDIKHIAYNTLVRPTLEYCAAVWDPYTKHNIEKLEQVNTRAARNFATPSVVLFAKGYTSSLHLTPDPQHSSTSG
ncbi:uncharacterized protein [Penaeus vannamei]|uniref:uncharacterized protein n=1 Tax=Penaeus vannamei TaxID=6689 RepID=UPI00387FABB0